MSDTTYAYPFDPTGTQPSNKIINESQVIASPGWTDFFFIVPQAAPFFRESLVVHLHPGGRRLHEGVDYAPSHRFHDASLATGKPVFGSISFYDKTLAGVAELTYQTVGGPWTLNEEQILDILSNKLRNPRITTWEQIVDLPERFPVIDHEWDLDDMVGMTEVVESLAGIEAALRDTSGSNFVAHLADLNNPHQTTKAQVGLGNVPNFGIATVPQAQAGTTNDALMSPLRVKQAIDVFAAQPLQQHRDNRSNPHDVTKSQVGLGNVVDLPLALEAEAIDGVLNSSYMTPLRVRQAINATAVAQLNVHATRQDNPHQVTKAQVQLGAVQNFGIASVEEARSGTANNLYMTPLLVREAISVSVAGDISSHVNNSNNPHGTTKAQVGLGNVPNYQVATTAEAQAGTANDRFMTPVRVKDYVDVVVASFNTHVNNTENPHMVTKAQVGLGNVDNFPTATTQDMIDGTSTARFATPAGVRAVIQSLDSGDATQHILDRNNPHQVTKQQVQLGNIENWTALSLDEANASVDLASVPQNRYLTPVSIKRLVDLSVNLTPYDDHIDDELNPHKVTATQVGAYTVTEVDQQMAGKLGRTEAAANAERLNGDTATELLNRVRNTYRYAEVRPVSTVVDDETVVTLEGTTWTRLAMATLSLTGVNGNDPIFGRQSAVQFTITGGESSLGTGTVSTYEVSVQPDRPQQSVAHRTAGSNSDLQLMQRWMRTSIDFGDNPPNNADPQHPSNYTHRYELWSRNVPSRNAIEINTTRYSAGVNGFFVNDAAALEEIPAGLTAMSRVLGGDDTDAGSMDFDIANVAANFDNDELTLADYTNDQVLLSELAQSFRHRLITPEGATRDAWDVAVSGHAWNNSDATTTLTGDILARHGSTSEFGDEVILATSASRMKNYALEIEMSNAYYHPTNQAKTLRGLAMGVCVASVERDGKHHGLYVYRTDGGIDGHGLLTFGYNLFGPDEVVFETTSAQLKWGDGEVDADRDAADYEEAVRDANGIVVGAARIGEVNPSPMSFRVQKRDGMITIEVTEFGEEGNYATGPSITFDLSDHPQMETLFGGESAWGVASRNVAECVVTATNCPGRFRSYYAVNDGMFDAGKDTRLSRVEYSGINNEPAITFASPDLSVHTAGPNVRKVNWANRMVYSPATGRLYLGQGNGALRYLLITADTIGDNNAITS